MCRVWSLLSALRNRHDALLPTSLESKKVSEPVKPGGHDVWISWLLLLLLLLLVCVYGVCASTLFRHRPRLTAHNKGPKSIDL